MGDYAIINGSLYHSDELMRYGIKGMKWGHRKGPSMITKAVTRANQKYERRQEYKQNKRTFRKARRNISKSRSLGHKLATNVLAGPFANRTYNSIRAAGGSRAVAIGGTYGAALLGGPIGHLGVSAIMTRTVELK